MDLPTLSNLVQIIGGVIVIVGAIYGLIRFIRQRQRERLLSAEGGFFPLPRDPRFDFFLDKIKQRLDKGETVAAIREIDEKKRNPIGLDPANPVNSMQELEATDPLAAANLLLHETEALLNLGDRRVLILLQRIIELCKSACPTSESQTQQKEQILGLAFNNIAYFYRSFKDYPRAQEEYRNAIPHLRQLKDKLPYAYSLNNLAFVYALQGKLTAAELICQDAIEIFQERGVKSGKAYGLNILGFIQVERRQHQIGLLRCKDSLELFESIRDQRGIGLACIFSAYSLQRLSERDVYSFQERIGYLEEAKKHSTRSVNIFLKLFEDKPYLVEAHGARGCIYRDWGMLARKAKQSLAEIEKLEDAALENLHDSFDKARELKVNAEQVDVLEDMAQVYFARRQFDQTKQLLEQATALVPSQYSISETKGLPTIQEPVTPYWASLGKIALLRGHIEYDSEHKTESAYWYTLAGAYLDLFASTTPLTDYAASSIYARLRNSQATQIAAWRYHADEIQEQYQMKRTQLMDILDQTLGVLDTSSPVAENSNEAKTSFAGA